MHKYIIRFSKSGTLSYISHLDLMRLYKRAFKRAGVKLIYSQGFNPHPKMGFAQPLSLGYNGLNEIIEFETESEFKTESLLEIMKAQMPRDLELKSCEKLDNMNKTLASIVESSSYIIIIPIKKAILMEEKELYGRYMNRDSIITTKRQKKKKQPIDVDIKPMIRSIAFTLKDDMLFVNTILDSGSISNLSPELVIDSLIACFSLDVDKGEINVTRTELHFSKNIHKS